MAKIILATLGSLGDLHPKIALGFELKRRGHDITLATMEVYAEKIESLGFEYKPLRPHLDINDRELTRELLETRSGPEKLLRDVILPELPGMYDDLTSAARGGDLLITGEIVYAARSVVEKTDIKWVSTSLAPMSLFSAYDPNVYPTAEWIEYLRPLPAAFHQVLFGVMKRTISHWFEPYREFRRGIGLSEDHDPVFQGKFSGLLHLVMFSKVMSPPQSDWPANSVQCGFCFYDGEAEVDVMPDGLNKFLDRGEPPIVFTLGSAASLDPRDFFDESAKAAKILGKRALLLYGAYNDPPDGLGESIVGFEYARYSQVFPKAACVVHQGGVGTTGQVLRAGVPHLIMPYGHDQPDNAARCRRLGLAEVMDRNSYTAETAVKELRRILANDNYRKMAANVAKAVQAEGGTIAACDAIEGALSLQSGV